jgi:tRNA-specific 2-thiouridylase
MTKSKGKVFVGMSGGVDSSVAAYLLQKQGYKVTGVYIRGYNVDGCAERDAEDARRAAEHLGILFYVFDMEGEYKESVVDYMVSAYRDGITPNPDVMCNKDIKFGLFLKKALALGADYIATGHYVKLRQNSLSRTERPLAPAASVALRSRSQNSRPAGGQAFVTSESFSRKNSSSLGLFEAKDKNKDQSYFLWTLTKEQLKYCLFPIGDYTKPQVREIARKAMLPTAEKKDSQGICFLGQVDLEDFLKQYLPEKPGDIVTTEGAVVGQHEGIYFYTIGQRHLGVDLKVKNPDHKPYYVASKDLASNTLVVAEGDNHPALFRKEMELRQVNFIDEKLPPLIRANGGIRILARVRYRQPLAQAELKIENSKLKIEFREPVKFVAPGQSAVFYAKSGEMLGGGVIV